MNWTEFQWHAIVFAARQAHAFRAYSAAGRCAGNEAQTKDMQARARSHEAVVRRFAREAMKGAQ